MIFSPPASSDLPGLKAWADRFIGELNRFHSPIGLWPIFADDAAAAAGQLRVGDGYVTPDGIARRRMV